MGLWNSFKTIWTETSTDALAAAGLDTSADCRLGYLVFFGPLSLGFANGPRGPAVLVDKLDAGVFKRAVW